MIALSNPVAGEEARFNDWYDRHHLADICAVHGVVRGQRFKLVSGTSEAVRTPVKLGKSSVNTIEILNGLQPGDQVILSDTSAWDAKERIRLN